MDATEATQEQRVWTIFDVHNTLVVYVRASYVPWYTGKQISKRQMIDTRKADEFNHALGKSQLAVKDQYAEWARMHGKSVEGLTPDDELEAESHFVLSGLEKLTELASGKRDSIDLNHSSATFVVPIAGFQKAYQQALSDRVIDRTHQIGCAAVISSSTTRQSSAVVKYLLGEEVYTRDFEAGRLAFVNAVRPNRYLMRDGKIYQLPDFEKPLSKSDSQTWLTAYVNAGIGERSPIVRVYEDKDPNLTAAFNAARQLGHYPETYKSLIERVNIST